MASITFLFIVGLVCTAHANPLGQTTVCETSPSMLSQLLPPYGATTVCETSPGVLPYGLPYPLSSLTLSQLQSLSPLPGSTTVCETSPNVVGLGGLGSLGIGYTSLPVGYSSASLLPLSNYLSPYNLPGYPLSGPYPYGSTVCESSPNLVGLYPNVPLVNSLGSSTVCETAPNVLPLGGLPLSYSSLYPGRGVTPLGVPFL